MTGWKRTTAVLAVSLLLAGCGSGADDEAADATETSAAEPANDGSAAEQTPTEDGTPLKVGVLVPTSGVLAANGTGNADGFTFYWSEAGSQSGDRLVEIIQEDTEADPETALTRAQKLVEQDGVDVLTGLVSSAAALAVQEYAISQEVPLVLQQAAASPLTSRPVAESGTARVIATFRQTMFPLAKWIAESEGHQNVVFLGSDYAPGHDAEQAVKDGMADAGGSVVQSVLPPLATQDFGPFLNRIDRSADAVVAFFAGADAQRFLQQYQEFGLGDIPLYGHWSLTVGPLLAQAGDEAIGVTTVQEYWADLDTPANGPFTEAWAATHDTPPNSWNEQGYTAAMLIDQLAQGSDTDAPDISSVAEMELETPRGVIGFDGNGQIIDPVYIATVEEIDSSKKNVQVDELGSISQEDVAP